MILNKLKYKLELEGESFCIETANSYSCHYYPDVYEETCMFLLTHLHHFCVHYMGIIYQNWNITAFMIGLDPIY